MHCSFACRIHMTRKKSNLHLKRPKWRKVHKPKDVLLPSPLKKTAGLSKTPVKSRNKRTLSRSPFVKSLATLQAESPIGKRLSPAPKRTRFLGHPVQNFTSSETNDDNLGCTAIDENDEEIQNDIIHERAETATEKHRSQIESEMVELIPAVLKKLAEEKCDDIVYNFFKQVNAGTFPLKNISFWL